jgi:DNA-binding NtrC family response regulator
MNRVALVSKDWQTRTLLRAQLLEEGLDVGAFESAGEAIEDSLSQSASLPALLIADLAASDEPTGEVDLLAAWARRVPIWVIASHSLIVDNKLKGRGFEVILFRPIDVGEIVEQIHRRLEKGIQCKPGSGSP